MTMVNYSTPKLAFELPPELQDLQKLVRRIVDEECIPLEAEFLQNGPSLVESSYEGAAEGSLPQQTWDRLEQISRDAGIFDVHLPEEYGGAGLGVLGNFVVDAEVKRSVVPLPTRWIPGLLFDGTEDQKQRYLLPMVEGTKRAAFAQTEPGAGSDPGNSMATRAVRDGDEWVLNGTKTFISGANHADFMLLLAVTDPERRQRGGITMFLVDTDLPGVSMSPLGIWMTPRVPKQFTVHLDDVRVPHENVLGAVGGGFQLGQQFLAVQDRLTRGSLACGILSRGLEMATDWARERTTFGRPLADRQAIQWMLVDVYIDLKCIRAVSYECAAKADRGEDVRVEASMAKYLGGNWGHRSIDKLLQIFGGMGESTEFPIV
ncbi:MAG: acyl-CoA dehydrogenase family protein, partial [Acidimicrobiia bacterium]